MREATTPLQTEQTVSAGAIPLAKDKPPSVHTQPVKVV